MQRSFGLSLPVFQHCRDDSKHYEIAVAAKHTQAVAGKGVPQTRGVVLGLGGQLVRFSLWIYQTLDSFEETTPRGKKLGNSF